MTERSSLAWTRSMRARVSVVVLAVVATAAAASGWLGPQSAAGALAAGARSMLVHGTAAAVLAVLMGSVLGATAGQVGGVWDGLVTRGIELMAMFPGVVLVALLCAMHRPSAWLWIAALAVVRVPESARLARAEVIRLAGLQFMQSARAMGASPLRLLFRHAGPHLAASLAQSFVYSLGAVVMIDAALVALGLGPSERSWGASIASAVLAGRPWAAVPAACALIATMLAPSGLAEMVRERLDPAAGPTTPLRAGPPGSR
jgi:ABC-type dipeptide/oligopeptide/nickel transport system permease subunit